MSRQRVAANVATQSRVGVERWLHQSESKDIPGRYQHVLRRPLSSKRGDTGQGLTCFAIKSAWHIGLWDDWALSNRSRHIDFVQSFQRPDGRFLDDRMLRAIKWGSLPSSIRAAEFADWPHGPVSRAIRAETRQSAATIMQVGARPRYPGPLEASNPEDLAEFLDSLDWTKPWAAGSHASHLVFELVWAASAGDSRAALLLDEAHGQIQRRRHPSGAWGDGEIATRELVNGAMKMLTAYRWAGWELDEGEQLLRLAIDQPFLDEGCGVVNRLFVVSELLRQCANRALVAEAEDLAGRAIEYVSRFQRGDGGFSFGARRAQTRYYGAWMSLGGVQGDMHGTVMFTWALALCFDVLAMSEDLGWHPSKP